MSKEGEKSDQDMGGWGSNHIHRGKRLLRRPMILADKMRRGPLPPHLTILEGGKCMDQYEKQLIRMELQVGQLISIIARLNERINELEEKELARKVIPIHIRRAAQRT